MAISFGCTCGKTLRVADEHAGKRVKCPVCQSPVLVPSASVAVPVVARPVVARPVSARPVQPVAAAEDAGFEVVDDEEPVRPKSRRTRDEDEEDERPSRPSRRSRRDEDDEEEDRPRKKKGRLAKRKAKRKNSSGGMRALYICGGILGVIVGGAIAYYAWDSEARRVGRVIGLGVVIAIAGLGGIFNGITGNVGESSDSRSDDDEDE